MIAVSVARARIEVTRRLVGALDGAAKARLRQRLVGEGLERAHRADQLGGIGGGIGEGVLGGARAPAHHAAERDQRQHDHRDGAEHEGGEPRARHQHHGGGAEEQHDVAQRDRDRGADRGLDLGGVGGEPRYQFAGLRGVEERRREDGDAVEHRVAQIGDDALADAGHEVVAHGAREREHGHHRDHDAEIFVDQTGAVGVEAVVDHAANRDRHREGRQRGDEKGGQRGDYPGAVAHDEGDQPDERLEAARTRALGRRRRRWTFHRGRLH